MQKRVMKIIMGCDYRDSCRELFKALSILTLSAQYIFSLVFFFVNNRDYFVSNSVYHNINTRNIVLYFINMWKWTKYTILSVSMFSIWDCLLIMKHAVLSLHNKEFMWVFHDRWLSSRKTRNFTVLVWTRIWSAYVKFNG